MNIGHRSSVIRLGTRDSKLAFWQARIVASALERFSMDAEIIPIKSTGDLDQVQPLYEMGITGIFTKALDTALLNGKIDIAVHSMKDVPTALPKGLTVAAVLKRDTPLDILVGMGKDTKTIATGSLRRKAQWLHKYPDYRVENLRGNVQTRLKKLSESDWYGAVFAKAGLDRLEIKPDKCTVLDWMLPAPAQGAIVVTAREDDHKTLKMLSLLDDPDTRLCVEIEREFLAVLEGGCSAPIGALAEVGDGMVSFKGAVFSKDGRQKIEIERTADVTNAVKLGRKCAEEILKKGGRELI